MIMLLVKQTCHMYGVLKNLFLKPKLSSYRFITSKPNYYTVLGIDQHASAEEIRAAFIKKSKECHPDTNHGNVDNHTQFVLVNEAYSTLKKQDSRRDYDLSLSQQQHNTNARNPTKFSRHHRRKMGYQTASNLKQNAEFFYRTYDDLNDLRRQSNDKFYTEQQNRRIKRVIILRFVIRFAIAVLLLIIASR